MHYLKIGPIKIPYQIRNDGEKKIFGICGLRIPFVTVNRGTKKYYRIFGLTLRLPFLDRFFISQGKTNFLMREQLDDEKIREVAAKIFEEKVGYKPNFDHPRSMNEKIFWFKLNYHNPLVTTCCDKFAVKDYVTEKLGKGYVIPTLQSWERAEDVDLDTLPDRFVLKVNWSSGYNIIVKDKSDIDQEDVRAKITYWMQPQQNSYYQTFNWGYKHMKPVVYAEQYMEQIDGQLYDYKFFCCNGKAKFWFIATDRYEDATLTHDFFDMDFNHLDFDYGGRAHSAQPLQKPKNFETMVALAEKLAEPFPFVRVDFYEIEGKVYVGEMTFYPGGGILPFDPVEWDYRLGEYIAIPKQHTNT